MRVVNHPNPVGREAEKRLGQYLDDRFTLAHRVRLPSRKNLVDSVLVGPHGVTVLALTSDPGRVRCLGDNWYIWNPQIKDFVGAAHNPIKQARRDRAAVETLLAGRQMGSVIPVDCAVLARQPSDQVEHMEPAVRIWPTDKIAEFAGRLASQRELIEWTQADDVLKALGLPLLGKPWSQLPKLSAQARAARSYRGGLQRWQMIFLAGMAVADLLVLIGGLAVVLLMR